MTKKITKSDIRGRGYRKKEKNSLKICLCQFFLKLCSCCFVSQEAVMILRWIKIKTNGKVVICTSEILVLTNPKNYNYPILPTWRINIYVWIFVKASAHRAFNSNFWHFLPPLIQCNVLKKPNKRKCFLLFHVTNCHFLVNDITKILQWPFSQLQLIISPWNNFVTLIFGLPYFL